MNNYDNPVLSGLANLVGSFGKTYASARENKADREAKLEMFGVKSDLDREKREQLYNLRLALENKKMDNATRRKMMDVYTALIGNPLSKAKDPNAMGGIGDVVDAQMNEFMSGLPGNPSSYLKKPQNPLEPKLPDFSIQDVKPPKSGVNKKITSPVHPMFKK